MYDNVSHGYPIVTQGRAGPRGKKDPPGPVGPMVYKFVQQHNNHITINEHNNFSGNIITGLNKGYSRTERRERQPWKDRS